MAASFVTVTTQSFRGFPPGLIEAGTSAATRPLRDRSFRGFSPGLIEAGTSAATRPLRDRSFRGFSPGLIIPAAARLSTPGRPQALDRDLSPAPLDPAAARLSTPPRRPGSAQGSPPRGPRRSPWDLSAAGSPLPLAPRGGPGARPGPVAGEGPIRSVPARTVETPRRSSVNLFKGHTTRGCGGGRSLNLGDPRDPLSAVLDPLGRHTYVKRRAAIAPWCWRALP